MSPIPEWVVTVLAAVTVCTVMGGIGLRVVLRDLGWIWERPGPIVRGLFSVLVAVPALAVLITRAFALPRLAQIGIVLMAIAPGAPIALRRSLGAGGHRAFAPTLQICVALLAVISMPLSIAVLNHVYAGHASVAPWEVARQVFFAQLLPIGIGIAVRRATPGFAERLEAAVGRLGTALLVILAVVAVIDLWSIAVSAGGRVLTAIALTTVAALAVGHWLGGPDPAVRTAVAISSAARNAGLALLVTAVNNAPPAVKATVLAYLAVSVFAIVPYVVWRRHVGSHSAPA
jgi:BASS family bile acid:Na+ symporter